MDDMRGEEGGGPHGENPVSTLMVRIVAVINSD